VVEVLGGLVLVVTSVVDVAAVEEGASDVIGEIVVVGTAVVAGAVVDVDATGAGGDGGVGGATTHAAANATGR
jgi:hypothetical protein